MIPYCAFPNTQSAATAVHRFHKDAYSDVTLTARPYNRFDPVNTTWWLIPSTEWPAYHQGKLTFYRSHSQDGETTLFVGLGVEKGFGPVVATIDRHIRSQIMSNGWLWPDLLADLKAGTVDSAVAQVAERTGMSVSVGVSASYYQDMEPGNPYAQLSRHDDLLFKARGASMELIRREIAVNILRDVAGSQTLADFGRSLASTPDRDWTWINLVFGVSFRMVPLNPGLDLPPGTWDETQLWDRALVPWLPWVR